MKAKIERIQGCLLGGAVGNALGAPVEFGQLDDIKACYGEDGITFANFKGPAKITDDTQMTLFTANGLLLPGDKLTNIWNCYQDWLDTQTKHNKSEMTHRPVSWLVDDQRLFSVREPGNTCITELKEKHFGSLTHPYNKNKGCGGIMRIAPIGLVNWSIEKVVECSARASALTHGSLISSIASVFFATMIHYLSRMEIDIAQAIDKTIKIVKNSITKQPAREEIIGEVNLARMLAENSPDRDAANIASLGQGWFADETLGIAVYCALKYEHDFEKAIEAAVNHDGNSDSTGNLTGQLLGARYGTKVLPKAFLAKLELRDVIEKMADMLANVK